MAPKDQLPLFQDGSLNDSSGLSTVLNAALHPNPVIIQVHGEDRHVTLPNAHFLLGADYTRHGSDLVLVGKDGHEIILHDYFNSDHPPDLVAGDNGAIINAHLAGRLAGPLAPGQYAQVGGDNALGAAIGKIATATGEVRVTHADGSKSILHVGDPIYAGDQINTSAGSNAGMTMADGSEMSIGEATRMVMDEFAYDPSGNGGNATVDIVKGTATFVSGQISKTSPGAYSFKTPVTDIGIRGTAGGIGVGDDGATTAALLPEVNGTGEMSIGGQVLNVAGQSSSVDSAGSGPTPPSPMSNEQFGQTFGSALAALPNAAQFIAPQALQQATQSYQQQQQQLQQQDQQQGLHSNQSSSTTNGFSPQNAADAMAQIHAALASLLGVLKMAPGGFALPGTLPPPPHLPPPPPQPSNPLAAEESNNNSASLDATAAQNDVIQAQTYWAEANTLVGSVTVDNASASLTSLSLLESQIATLALDAQNHTNHAQSLAAEFASAADSAATANVAASSVALLSAEIQADDLAVQSVTAGSLSTTLSLDLFQTLYQDSQTIAADETALGLAQNTLSLALATLAELQTGSGDVNDGGLNQMTVLEQAGTYLSTADGDLYNYGQAKAQLYDTSLALAAWQSMDGTITNHGTIELNTVTLDYIDASLSVVSNSLVVGTVSLQDITTALTSAESDTGALRIADVVTAQTDAALVEAQALTGFQQAYAVADLQDNGVTLTDSEIAALNPATLSADTLVAGSSYDAAVKSWYTAWEVASIVLSSVDSLSTSSTPSVSDVTSALSVVSSVVNDLAGLENYYTSLVTTAASSNNTALSTYTTDFATYTNYLQSDAYTTIQSDVSAAETTIATDLAAVNTAIGQLNTDQGTLASDMSALAMAEISTEVKASSLTDQIGQDMADVQNQMAKITAALADAATQYANHSGDTQTLDPLVQHDATIIQSAATSIAQDISAANALDTSLTNIQTAATAVETALSSSTIVLDATTTATLESVITNIGKSVASAASDMQSMGQDSAQIASDYSLTLDYDPTSTQTIEAASITLLASQVSSSVQAVAALSTNLISVQQSAALADTLAGSNATVAADYTRVESDISIETAAQNSLTLLNTEIKNATILAMAQSYALEASSLTTQASHYAALAQTDLSTEITDAAAVETAILANASASIASQLTTANNQTAQAATAVSAASADLQGMFNFDTLTFSASSHSLATDAATVVSAAEAVTTAYSTASTALTSASAAVSALNELGGSQTSEADAADTTYSTLLGQVGTIQQDAATTGSAADPSAGGYAGSAAQYTVAGSALGTAYLNFTAAESAALSAASIAVANAEALIATEEAAQATAEASAAAATGSYAAAAEAAVGISISNGTATYIAENAYAALEATQTDFNDGNYSAISGDASTVVGYTGIAESDFALATTAALGYQSALTAQVDASIANTEAEIFAADAQAMATAAGNAVSAAAAWRTGTVIIAAQLEAGPLLTDASAALTTATSTETTAINTAAAAQSAAQSAQISEASDAASETSYIQSLEQALETFLTSVGETPTDSTVSSALLAAEAFIHGTITSTGVDATDLTAIYNALNTYTESASVSATMSLVQDAWLTGYKATYEAWSAAETALTQSEANLSVAIQYQATTNSQALAAEAAVATAEAGVASAAANVASTTTTEDSDQEIAAQIATAAMSTANATAHTALTDAGSQASTIQTQTANSYTDEVNGSLSLASTALSAANSALTLLTADDANASTALTAAEAALTLAVLPTGNVTYTVDGVATTLSIASAALSSAYDAAVTAYDTASLNLTRIEAYQAQVHSQYLAEETAYTLALDAYNTVISETAEEQQATELAAAISGASASASAALAAESQTLASPNSTPMALLTSDIATATNTLEGHTTAIAQEQSALTGLSSSILNVSLSGISAALEAISPAIITVPGSVTLAELSAELSSSSAAVNAALNTANLYSSQAATDHNTALTASNDATADYATASSGTVSLAEAAQAAQNAASQANTAASAAEDISNLRNSLSLETTVYNQASSAESWYSAALQYESASASSTTAQNSATVAGTEATSASNTASSISSSLYGAWSGNTSAKTADATSYGQLQAAESAAQNALSQLTAASAALSAALGSSSSTASLLGETQTALEGYAATALLAQSANALAAAQAEAEVVTANSATATYAANIAGYAATIAADSLTIANEQTIATSLSLNLTAATTVLNYVNAASTLAATGEAAATDASTQATDVQQDGQSVFTNLSSTSTASAALTSASTALAKAEADYTTALNADTNAHNSLSLAEAVSHLTTAASTALLGSLAVSVASADTALSSALQSETAAESAYLAASTALANSTDYGQIITALHSSVQGDETQATSVLSDANTQLSNANKVYSSGTYSVSSTATTLGIANALAALEAEITADISSISSQTSTIYTQASGSLTTLGSAASTLLSTVTNDYNTLSLAVSAVSTGSLAVHNDDNALSTLSAISTPTTANLTSAQSDATDANNQMQGGGTVATGLVQSDQEAQLYETALTAAANQYSALENNYVQINSYVVAATQAADASLVQAAELSVSSFTVTSGSITVNENVVTNGTLSSNSVAFSPHAIESTNSLITQQSTILLSASAADGSVTISNGTLSYKANVGFYGTDTITVTELDTATISLSGFETETITAQSTGTVTVTVERVDQTPTLSAISETASENFPLTLGTAAVDAAFSSLDTSATLGDIKIVSLPTASTGTLTLSGTVVTAGETLTQSQYGALVFTPASNYVGTASFTIEAMDAYGVLTGSTLWSAAQTVALTITETTQSITSHSIKLSSLASGSSEVITGTGNDTITLGSSDGATVSLVETGTTSLLDASGLSQHALLDAYQSGNNAVFQLTSSGGGGELIVENQFASTPQGLEGIIGTHSSGTLTIVGSNSEANGTLSGTGTSELILANEGEATVIANGQDNTIYAGGGSQTLIGNDSFTPAADNSSFDGGTVNFSDLGTDTLHYAVQSSLRVQSTDTVSNAIAISLKGGGYELVWTDQITDKVLAQQYNNSDQAVGTQTTLASPGENIAKLSGTGEGNGFAVAFEEGSTTASGSPSGPYTLESLNDSTGTGGTGTVSNTLVLATGLSADAGLALSSQSSTSLTVAYDVGTGSITLDTISLGTTETLSSGSTLITPSTADSYINMTDNGSVILWQSSGSSYVGGSALTTAVQTAIDADFSGISNGNLAAFATASSFALAGMETIGGTTYLVAEVLNSSGAVTNSIILQTNEASVSSLRINTLSSGGYAVDWAGTSSAGVANVEAAIFSPGGNSETSSPIVLATGSAASGASLGKISALSDESALMVWSSGTDVYTQHFDANGDAAGTVTINSGTTTLYTDSLYNINTIVGTAGNDSFTMGPGNTSFDASSGNDTYNNSAGLSSGAVSYQDIGNAVTINLAESSANAIKGTSGTDNLIDVTSVIGSGYADTITGGNVTGATYTLDSGGGADILTGGSSATDFIIGANDGATVTGGAGYNQLWFESTALSASGATYSLTANGGTHVSGIDAIQLYNGYVTTLVMNADGAIATELRSNQTVGTLTIEGTSGDTVVINGAWTLLTASETNTTPDTGFITNGFTTYEGFGTGSYAGDTLFLNVNSSITISVPNDSIAVTLGTTSPTVTAQHTFSGTISATDSNGYAVISTASALDGTVILEANGAYTYQSNSGFVGTDTITFVSSDSEGTRQTTTQQIAVSDALTASATSETGRSQTTVTGSFSISDAAGIDAQSALIANTTATALHGTVSLASNGSYTYTSNSGYTGTDTITFTTTEGSLSTQTTASVVVTSSTSVLDVETSQSINANGYSILNAFSEGESYGNIVLTGSTLSAITINTGYDDSFNDIINLQTALSSSTINFLDGYYNALYIEGSIASSVVNFGSLGGNVTVLYDGSTLSNSTFNLGNGNSNTFTEQAGASISDSTITLGSGTNNVVNIDGTMDASSVINLGTGTATININALGHETITASSVGFGTINITAADLTNGGNVAVIADYNPLHTTINAEFINSSTPLSAIGIEAVLLNASTGEVALEENSGFGYDEFAIIATSTATTQAQANALLRTWETDGAVLVNSLTVSEDTASGVAYAPDSVTTITSNELTGYSTLNLDFDGVPGLNDILTQSGTIGLSDLTINDGYGSSYYITLNIATQLSFSTINFEVGNLDTLTVSANMTDVTVNFGTFSDNSVIINSGTLSNDTFNMNAGGSDYFTASSGASLANVTVIFGNGSNDTINLNDTTTNSVFELGNGNDDIFSAASSASFYNATIDIGNGADDQVYINAAMDGSSVLNLGTGSTNVYLTVDGAETINASSTGTDQFFISAFGTSAPIINNFNPAFDTINAEFTDTVNPLYAAGVEAVLVNAATGAVALEVSIDGGKTFNEFAIIDDTTATSSAAAAALLTTWEDDGSVLVNGQQINTVGIAGTVDVPSWVTTITSDDVSGITNLNVDSFGLSNVTDTLSQSGTMVFDDLNINDGFGGNSDQLIIDGTTTLENSAIDFLNGNYDILTVYGTLSNVTVSFGTDNQNTVTLYSGAIVGSTINMDNANTNSFTENAGASISDTTINMGNGVYNTLALSGTVDSSTTINLGTGQDDVTLNSLGGEVFYLTATGRDDFTFDMADLTGSGTVPIINNFHASLDTITPEFSGNPERIVLENAGTGDVLLQESGNEGVSYASFAQIYDATSVTQNGTYDLGGLVVGLSQNIQAIDVSNVGETSFTLNSSYVNALVNQGDTTIVLTGNYSDTVSLDSGWTEQSTTNLSGYAEYTHTSSSGQTVTLDVAAVLGADIITQTVGNSGGTITAEQVYTGDFTTSDSKGLEVGTTASALDGEVTLLPNGVYHYVSNLGFVGTDTITFISSDAAGTQQTVTSQVVVTDSLTQTETNPSTATTQSVVEGNWTTTDAAGLIETPQATAGHGSVTVNPDGTYTYESASGYLGTDTITFTTSDAAGVLHTNTTTVTVSDAITSSIASGQTGEGIPITLGYSVTDAAGLSTTTSITASDGSVSISDGTYVYTPEAGFTGTDTLTLVTTNSTGQTSTETAQITVLEPVVANGSVAVSLNVTDDNVVTISSSNSFYLDGIPVTANMEGGYSADFTPSYFGNTLQFGFSQPGVNTVTLTSDGTSTTENFMVLPNFTEQVTHSALTYSEEGNVTNLGFGLTSTLGSLAPDETYSLTVRSRNGTFSYDGGEGAPTGETISSDQHTTTITGDAAVIASALAQLDYTNDTGFVGTDFVQTTLQDITSTYGTLVPSSTDVAEVIVWNTASAIVAMEHSTETNTLFIPTSDQFLNTESAPSFSILSDTENGGSLSLTLSGTVANYTFTPEANFTGLDSFTLSVTDSTNGDVTTDIVTFDVVNPIQNIAAVTVSPITGYVTFSNDQMLGFSNPTALATGSGAFTYATWVNASYNADASQQLVNIGYFGISSGTSVSMAINTDGRLVLQFGWDGTDIALSNTVVANNTWEYVTATYSGGTQGVMSIYVNSALEDQITVTGTSVDILPGQALLGGYNSLGLTSASDDALTGEMADTGIWGSALTQTQIEANMESGTASQGSDLLAFIPMNGTISIDGTATLQDTSGNGNTIALTDGLSVTTTQSRTYSGQLTATDNTGSITGWTLESNEGPSDGTLSLNSDGSFTYTPNAYWHGVDSFTVEATDNNGLTATQVIDITVAPYITLNDSSTVINNTITLINTSATTTTGGSSAATGTFSVTDAMGTVTGSLVGAVAASTEYLITEYGTVSLNTATLEYTYTADSGFAGLDSFTLALNDANGGPVTDDVIYVDVIGVANMTNVNVTAQMAHSLDLAPVGLTQGNAGGDDFTATLTVANGKLTDNSLEANITSTDSGQTLVITGGYDGIVSALQDVIYTANASTTATSDSLTETIDVNSTLALISSTSISIAASGTGPTISGSYGLFNGGGFGEFSGDSYAALSNATVSSQMNSVTVEARINWNGSSDPGGSFIFYNGNSSATGYGLFVNPDGTIEFVAGGRGYATAEDFTLTAGAWTNLALVISSTGVLSLYANGVQYGFSSNVSINALTGTAEETTIGNWYSPTSSYANGAGYSNSQGFNGEIASVAFWNEVRTPDQITTDASQLPTANSYLAGYYSFDPTSQGSGLVTNNISFEHGTPLVAIAIGGAAIAGQISATDEAGYSLTYALESATTAHGSVSISSAGEYTYTANSGYYGADSFVAEITADGTTVRDTISVISAQAVLAPDTTDGYWSTAFTTTPGATDLVVLNEQQFTVDTSSAILGFSLENGSSLTLSGGNTLSILADAMIDSNSTLAIKNSSELYIASGSYVVDQGALSVADGHPVIDSGTIAYDYGIIAGPGTFVLTGAYDVGDYAYLIVNGNLNLDTASAVVTDIYGDGNVSNSGTIIIDSETTITPTFTNNASGTISLTAETSAYLQVAFGSSLTNNGTILLEGLGLSVAGTLLNTGAIEYNGYSNTIAASTVNNEGIITVSGSSQNLVINPLLQLTNEGTIIVAGFGELSVSGTGDYYTPFINSGDLIFNNSESELDLVSENYNLTNTLISSGTIELNTANETNNSEVTIDGNVLLQSKSDIILHDHAWGIDQVDINGSLTLNGTLDIQIVAEPNAADSPGVTAFNADSMGGGFTTIHGLFDPSNLTYLLDPSYSYDSFSLTAESVSETPTAASTTLTGEYLIADAGGSTLVGYNSTTDTSTGAVLLGQGGNDDFIISSTDFDMVNGGMGFNTLTWEPGATSSQNMNLASILPGLVENIQEIDLSKVTGATLTLNAANVEAMTQNAANQFTVTEGTVSNPALIIFGTTGESVQFTDNGWSTGSAATVTANGQSNNYEVYTNTNEHVAVLVHTGMTATGHA